LLASQYTPAALGLLLLLGLAVWLMPTRIEVVITDVATGEARVVTGWNTSHWQAFAAHWWQALLVASAFAGVFCVVWFGRGWVVARASAARFFVASLLVHCLLVLWIGAMPLARAVMEHAEKIQAAQAAQLFEEEPQPARPGGGRAPFEQVADLRAEETLTPEIVRQATAPVNLPDAGGPLVPTIPAHAVRSLPPERLVFVAPLRPEPVRRPQEIERSVIIRAMKPVEIKLDSPELPPPEAAPREKPLEPRPSAQPRLEPVGPDPLGPEPSGLPELKPLQPADVRPAVVDLPPVRRTDQLPPALTRRLDPGRVLAAAPREPAAQPKAEPLPGEGPPADVRVTLPRQAPSTPQFPVRTPAELTGPRLPDQPVRVGAQSPRAVEALPRFGPYTQGSSLLPRTSPGIGRVAQIEDRVASQAPLVLRQKEERQRSVELFGGTRASEEAVERGLDWLASQQNANGSWSLNRPMADAGTVTSDPAGTGMVLLPFLGAGNTHQSGKHKEAVARALKWLVEQQRPDGTWLAPGDARPMYGHGMASIVLCEAYGMTQDARLREPAQKALDYIVNAQHSASGGWRYQPHQPADTSVVGWQVMALKSGEMAGLKVPPKVFDGVKRWLESVEANRPVGGQFGYQSNTPSPAMTAQGLLCLQYLGTRRDDPRMRAGTDYLLAHLPQATGDTSYYWYHANQVMYHMQGKHWKAWNDRLRDLLVSTQSARAGLAGSWDPVDAREKPGGRLYATAIRVLMLEVYYRHLPLYQQLEK
jgi:hypothetical protein